MQVALVDQLEAQTIRTIYKLSYEKKTISIYNLVYGEKLNFHYLI